MAFKYSTTKLNEEIVYIKVSNGNKIEAEFCNFGAGIRTILFDGEPLLLEASQEDYPFLSDYYGKTLARVAGRIKCHGILDGQEYELAETTAEYCLHGGDIRSPSYQAWDYKIKESSKKIQIIFSKNSKKNELGFPGACKMQVIYEVYQNNNFKIIYKGTTPSATLLNMSNHNYYNFFNSHDLSDYKLKINASRVATIDDTIFITGYENVLPMYDFRKSTKLSARMKYFEKTTIGTIDFTYLFDEVNTKKPQIELKNKDMKLSLYTDYPSANIFVDNLMKGIKFSQYKNGEIVKRRGIALEPQLFVYDKDSLVLRRGERYQHFILLKFKDLRK